MHCETNLILISSANILCAISSNTDANQPTIFATTDTKLYATVVSSSNNYNANLLQQLKSGFKITVNWNKFQSKVTMSTKNQCLDTLLDASFQGVNKLFILSNENNAHLYTKDIFIQLEEKLKNKVP